MSNIQVSLQVPDGAEIARIFSLCSARELPHRLKGKEARFRVPRLEEYDVLVVEYR